MPMEHTVQVAQLAQRNEMAFEIVFKQYFKPLHAYATSIIRNQEAAEGIVQHIFLNLWEKAGQLNLSPGIAAYLYKSVHNHSLNYLKHQKVRTSYHQFAMANHSTSQENTSRKVLLTDLEKRYRKVLADLPEQCRTIFQLSRFEELRNHEIAEKLGISIKTVEAQITKALKILRSRLAEFIPLLLLCIANFLKSQQ